MSKIGLYVHIPFCIRKCAYCDFLSFTSTKESIEAYIEALKKEIYAYHKEKLIVDSIFLGGGTPSSIESFHIQSIMEALKETFQVERDAEITIEVNPGTFTEEKAHTYKQCGINRLSIGLQTTHNHLLQKLSRIHTYEQFLDTYQIARNEGFTNINIDLMSALPGETLPEYQEDLKKIILLKPEHISAYSLIIEENTLFYDAYNENPELLPNEEVERKMYWLTKQMLRENSYERYEISNYAKKGFECKHNKKYWELEDYIGLGLGASSCFKNIRFKNSTDLNQYINFWNDYNQKLELDITKMKTYFDEYLPIEKEEAMKEYMLLGLRMDNGISLQKFQKEFGMSALEEFREKLDKLKQEGLLQIDAECIRLTEFGVDVSNQVFVEFI